MATVLIVDDEELMRKLIGKSLLRLGYEIEEATNGIEALTCLENEPFDLIIMDLIMPGKGGIETLIEIHHMYPFIKRIAISGKVETQNDSIQELVKQFNVDAVFAKPFEIFDLLEKIEELVPLHHSKGK